MMQLGPFDLDAFAGRGAMGEVWSAVHRSQGVPAAIKIVTAPVGRQQSFRTGFAHEIRAVARLDHPGVVRIYDHGEIPEALARATGGRLPAGAPYLAMEWLGGGPIGGGASGGPGRLPWPRLRRLLLGVLDALAHAHARGVVHRDLKPDNILMAERGPVLTDFGVAYTAERAADSRSEAFAGTPNYMSPEQVTGDLRALGPWTDLYAVGCLACTLVRGRPPFAARTAALVARFQLTRPPPLLDDDLPVPVGFEEWMHRLLAKHPDDRFRFAADAAVALMALPDEAPAPADAGPAGDEAPPDDAAATVIGAPLALSLPAAEWLAGPGPDDRPPVPRAWRPPARGSSPPPLLGVGRSLFGLRAPALHGRRPERDALWRALVEVAEGAEARAVLISGASGQGKSRLATWLGQRAHELGVADLLLGAHDANDGPDNGLGPMIARYTRADDLPGEARRRRLTAALGAEVDPALIRSLSATIAPYGRWADSDGGVLIASATERNAVLADALAALARRRPLVLHLEDVHWSEETLGFVDYVLTLRPDLPVLIVGTVRDDVISEGGAVQALLDHLTARSSVRRLRLGPLDADQLADQIRTRLPLARDLTARITARAAGNPLFAEALVEHWLRVDALEDAPEGFRLKPGFRGALPDGLRSIWRARLDDLLRDDDGARQGLEIAAALGQNVDVDEWRHAQRIAGIERVAAATVEALLDAGLIAGDASTRWSFVHPLLREALLDDADRAARLPRWHRACARLLAGRKSPDRQAHHLMSAEAWDDALEPLLYAARDAIEHKEPGRAHRALAARCRALRVLRRTHRDREWTEIRILWARLCVLDGRALPAVRHAGRAARAAEVIGDDALIANALIEHARALAIVRSMGQGLALIRVAIERAAASRQPVLEARALKELGRFLLSSGDRAGAIAAYTRALQLVEGLGETMMEASLTGALGNLARGAGDHDRARALVTRARDVFRAAGSRGGQAHMTNLLGEIVRFQGDLDAAEANYRESLRLFGGLGSFDGLTVEANLALVLSETGRWTEARQRLENLAARAREMHNRELYEIFCSCRLPSLAAQGDWAAWDAVYADITLLRAGKLVEPDVARSAENAAGLATRAGQPARAAQAWALAITQLERIGRDAGPARAALAALDTEGD